VTKPSPENCKNCLSECAMNVHNFSFKIPPAAENCTVWVPLTDIVEDKCWLCMCTARCDTVRPIRQWQTEEHYRTLAKHRQAKSSQRRVCDLSIHGEAIATPSRPESTVSSPSGYNRRTAEMDIDTVHQACRPTAAAVTRARTRGSYAADIHGPCRRLSPECRTQRNPWDFDPFLQDDTGRMISTRTPVAKMTAPLSTMNVPRVESAVAGKQHAGKSDENSSSGKSNDGKKVTAGKQRASRLSKSNSSDKSAPLVIEVTTPVSVSKVTSVDAASKLDRNNSLKKFKNANEVADKGDKNNSSNKWNVTTGNSLIITSAVKDGEGKRRASKSENRNSSNQEKDDGEEKEDALSLPDAEKERSVSETVLQPAEKHRRSPSLQVTFYLSWLHDELRTDSMYIASQNCVCVCVCVLTRLAQIITAACMETCNPAWGSAHYGDNSCRTFRQTFFREKLPLSFRKVPHPPEQTSVRHFL